jgi:mannose-1-phosphate guanylyltransferase
LASTKPVNWLAALVPPEQVLVITNESLVEACRCAIPQVPAENVIGEPCGRDTAAACALAGAIVAKRCPDAVLAMLTADHVMRDGDRFRAVLGAAYERALREPVIVTLGIKPDYPSTGFGYIECGEGAAESGVVFRPAIRFVEKPDRSTAEGYLQTGRYLWNGGMFIWHVRTLQDALDRHVPVLAQMTRDLMPAVDTAGFCSALRAAYAPLSRISIDYAVMEKAANIVTAESSFGWLDVGTWAALEKLHEKDAQGNILLGVSEALDSRGNLVVSRERLTALIGVEDLVVVHAGDATLICPKNRTEDVKQMVQALAARGDCDAYL